MKYRSLFLFAIPSTLGTGHFNQYFIENSNRLYLFLMPLSTQPPQVKLLIHNEGKKISERSFYWYKGNNTLLRYLFFYLYYLYCVLFIVPAKTIILATTPQYCMGSSLLRLLQKEVVYHVGDYYPSSTGLMRVYQFLIHYYNDRLPYVVYCSPLLEKLLRKGKKGSDGNREYWVFGVENKKVVRTPQKNLLGYIGVLREGQGIEILFEVLKRNKDLSLEIMGDGPLRIKLETLAKKEGVNKQVSFLGLLQDEKKVAATVSHWEVGLAPYEPSTTNMTYFGDPSKVKFYIEHQIPVIMTDITYMASELRKYQAGVCIEYTAESLSTAIKEVQHNYDSYVKGVQKIAKAYDYTALYDRKFRFFTKIWG